MKNQWLKELEIIVRKNNQTACNINEWSSWWDWDASFDSGMTPEQSYMDSISDNQTNVENMFGQGMS